MSEAINIAITELEAVEREIGVPSKALPLLRAMRTTPGPASVAVTALRRIVDEGDYTAPEGMTRIAREALEQSSTAHEPRANTEGEVGLAADVGPGGGASASASGATHAPELSPALPPADEQIDHAIQRIEECELSMDDSEGLVAMLRELKQLRGSQPPGCKQCPHVVGDTYQRDCGYPDCSPRASSPPPADRSFERVAIRDDKTWPFSPIWKIGGVQFVEFDIAIEAIRKAERAPREPSPPPEGQFAIGETVRVGPFHNGEYSKLMKITGAQYFCDHEFGPYSPSVLARDALTKSGVPGSQPIGEYMAELRKDPEWKAEFAAADKAPCMHPNMEELRKCPECRQAWWPTGETSSAHVVEEGCAHCAGVGLLGHPPSRCPFCSGGVRRRDSESEGESR